MGASGRSWTVAGSSLANMFPDQLRVPKRRDNANAANESSSSPDTSSPQAPLRLSDMLKRKRVSKRSSNRKGRHSDGGATASAAASAAAASSDLTAGTSGSVSSSAPSSAQTGHAYAIHGYDMPTLVSHELGAGPASTSSTNQSSATPSRRSRLADRTSSILSQLHPSRWVRSSALGAHHHHHGGHHGSSSVDGASSHSHSRKDSSPSILNTPGGGHKAIVTSPATLAHSREKAKR